MKKELGGKLWWILINYIWNTKHLLKKIHNISLEL
jgi:hypothetical protein